jgi:membrane fusion protein (multidrug efflux system)
MSSVVLERDTTVRPDRQRRAVLNRNRLLAAAGALVLATGGAWYGHDWWITGRFIETTDDAYVGGNVTALAPHIAGFVTEIAVTDNQFVRAGQLLVRIDPRDYQTALDHALAVVAAREAALTSLRAQAVLQQSTIGQAAAELEAKVAQAAFAHADAVRYATLARTPAGSRQDAERTLAGDQAGQAAIAAAQAGLAAARQRLAVIAADTAAAEATVVQARSDVQNARLNLGYTEIRAPVDGYVGNRAAQLGAYVAPGAYLLSVSPAQGLWVEANFKEDQLARMRPGQPARVVADVVSGQVLHGHVLSLAPGTGAIYSVIPPENATGNFTKIVQRVPVRIALDGADATLGTLRPGLSTTVSVDTKQATKSDTQLNAGAVP